MHIFLGKVEKGRKKWHKEPYGCIVPRSGGHHARRQGARRYSNAPPRSAAAIGEVARAHRTSGRLRADLSGRGLGTGAREGRRVSELRSEGELVEASAARLRRARRARRLR